MLLGFLFIKTKLSEGEEDFYVFLGKLSSVFGGFIGLGKDNLLSCLAVALYKKVTVFSGVNGFLDFGVGLL